MNEIFVSMCQLLFNLSFLLFCFCIQTSFFFVDKLSGSFSCQEKQNIGSFLREEKASPAYEKMFIYAFMGLIQMFEAASMGASAALQPFLNRGTKNFKTS